jgi:hypothetical protein
MNHGTAHTILITALPTANAAARSPSAPGTAAAMTPSAAMAIVTVIQIDGAIRTPNRFIVTVAFTHAHQAAARNAKNTAPSIHDGAP